LFICSELLFEIIVNNMTIVVIIGILNTVSWYYYARQQPC